MGSTPKCKNLLLRENNKPHTPQPGVIHIIP